MKRIPVLLSLLGLLFMTAGTSMAQRGMNPEQMKERMTTQVEEAIVALALEGDRAETVRLVLMTQGEKRLDMQTAMRGGRGGGQGRAQQGQSGQGQGDQRAGRMRMREQMQALDQETMTMLKEVLTEDELVKYAEFVASQRPGGRRGNAQIQ
ncbi:MAG: hypothetical protein HKN29_13265 [Rhodothermales bacterium]|nr:hypothetical protein [Rhodothermales bacterium]